jgi:hypothetical protein
VILPEQKIHVYEVRPRSDKRGFDLISDALALVGLRTARRETVDPQSCMRIAATVNGSIVRADES